MLSSSHRINNQILINYFKSIFPDGEYYLNPWLGKIVWRGSPRSKLGRIRGELINCEARADVIMIFKGWVYIIEKLSKSGSAKLSQLEEYEKLFRQTLHFKDYWYYPIQKVLFTTSHHPLIESKAIAKGIKVIQCPPSYLPNYPF